MAQHHLDFHHYERDPVIDFQYLHLEKNSVRTVGWNLVAKAAGKLNCNSWQIVAADRKLELQLIRNQNSLIP
ncbi:hypothetical protein L1987_48329 [Smallanthus sonchifolius]|uniref:Uncharacterized protein n=1 Tax=Smallanthus sonchifolius TaxID=185202 RepID=A0ACB9FS54_9ASTR|nr:hypothetical protein L1987_48329 [Smallanthus sonchifolius]